MCIKNVNKFIYSSHKNNTFACFFQNGCFLNPMMNPAGIKKFIPCRLGKIN
jgi:hypothetical protein